MKLHCVVIAVGFAFANGVQAQGFNGQYFNGNAIYEWARAPIGDFKRGAFMGYVAGVYDAVRQYKEFCTPTGPRGVLVGQVADAVQQWLERNPTERHKDADVLIRLALREAWPCQQSGNEEKPPAASPLDTPPTIRRY